MNYDIEFRERVLFFVDAGFSIAEAARNFFISPQTIRSWIKRYKSEGNVNPRKVGSRGRPKINREEVVAYVEKFPDSTLMEIAKNFGVSDVAIYKILKKEGITRKKTTTYKEASKEAQETFLTELSEIPPENRAYMDESGFDSRDQRAFGRAKRGVKVLNKVSGKRKKRVNVIGALFGKALKGTLRVIESVCKKTFTEWIELELIPLLNPDPVVIMDNASIHKSKEINDLIKSAKCRLLYLPPYSPELNPIEHKWGSVKAIYRGLDPEAYGHGFRVLEALHRVNVS